MSLNWDATGVAGIDNLTDEERFNLQQLVWASMHVGIPHITEKNVREFYIRLNLVEKVCGAYRMNGPTGEPVFFTPAEVKRFIGLRTNVSERTKAKFVHNLYNMVDNYTSDNI